MKTFTARADFHARRLKSRPRPPESRYVLTWILLAALAYAVSRYSRSLEDELWLPAVDWKPLAAGHYLHMLKLQMEADRNPLSEPAEAKVIAWAQQFNLDPDREFEVRDRFNELRQAYPLLTMDQLDHVLGLYAHAWRDVFNLHMHAAIMRLHVDDEALASASADGVAARQKVARLMNTDLLHRAQEAEPRAPQLPAGKTTPNAAAA